MKKPDLSIVLPCYNEEKNIPLILEKFKNIENKKINIELVLVDNGSTDNSRKVMLELINKDPAIKIAVVKKNIGYGFGIWTGLKAAKGEYVCWSHADMQTDLHDCIKAYDIAKKYGRKEVFVKGNRRKRPFVDSFFTLGMSIFESLILGKVLYDINAQPNLFHNSFLKKVKNPPYDFSFDLYFYYTAKIKRYRLIRFPVDFGKRIHGESHWNTSLAAKWKFIKRTIIFTIGLKKKLKEEKRLEKDNLRGR
jgi:glycosyltransferase involved in cell wall biosynthesis